MPVRRGVHPPDQGPDRRGRSRRGPRGSATRALRSSTSARPRRSRRASCPAPSTSRAATSSRASRARPRPLDQRVDPLLRLRQPLGARRPHARDDLGYEDVESMTGGYHAVEGPRLRGRGPAQVHARAAPALLAATSCCRRSARRASRSCSTPRCCCSAPAASARRPRCTSPPPASARSGSSTTTSSTSPTSSARSSTRPTASASPKVDSAEISMKAINPDVNVVKYETRLDASNIMEIIEGYDVIVDGVDNFPTRYLLNDATVRLQIPVVSASILGFDGQLSVFAALRRARATAACTRCRRRPSWRRPAAPTASSACCRGRWACCRRPRSSSSSSARASR